MWEIGKIFFLCKLSFFTAPTQGGCWVVMLAKVNYVVAKVY